jgi:hypothetical protein
MARLAPAPLFGGGDGRGLRRGEDRGGLFGDAGALEEFRVLPTPQLDCVRRGEGAKVVRRDVAVLDQFILNPAVEPWISI